MNIAAENRHDFDFPRPGPGRSDLAEYQIDHSRLEMDVSETAIMVDQVNSLSAIKKLSDMGIEIAIDDFGTRLFIPGLHPKLAVTHLKIDRSFVARMDQPDRTARQIHFHYRRWPQPRAMRDRQRVDNKATWDTLKAFGCDSGLSHPLPHDELVAWIVGQENIKEETNAFSFN